jgi:hypothetical protein
MSTFGNTLATGSWVSLVANHIYATKFGLSEDGTVSSINMYNGTDSGSPSIQYAVYDDSGNRKGNTGAYTLTASYDWHPLDLSSSAFLVAGTYWLCYNVDAGGGYSKYNAGTDILADISQAYGTWPATLSGTFSGDIMPSIYATYTAGGATKTNVVYMTFES